MQKDSNDLDITSCPSCQKSLVEDREKGEFVCPYCGFVVKGKVEDQGPGWKAIDLEDKQRRVHVGSPRTLGLHDYGLTTEIGNNIGESYGNGLDPYMRMSINKMKKWHTRVRVLTAEERGLSIVLSKMNEICSILNLPKTVFETAAHIYRTAMKMKVAKSKSIIGMSCASIYLACRKCNVGRTLKEIAHAANIDEKVLAKYYRFVLKEVEKEYIPPLSIERYISKFTNMAKIDPKVERLALFLAAQTKDSKISSGKTPVGLAAAYVYMSSVLLGEYLPQRDIADVAGVTEVTVRNRCREILENFHVKQILKPIRDE
ncbi:MAG: transcription factor IIB [Nitrososphaerales archaeon]|nr:transcription factor IIB [Nitrososphaerales archaeon]